MKGDAEHKEGWWPGRSSRSGDGAAASHKRRNQDLISGLLPLSLIWQPFYHLAWLMRKK